MKKLVSSIHVGLAFSKRKIFGLTLLFLMPLKVNANDMNSSYQVSVARNIRHEQENRLQDEKNDSAMSPNFIAIFQPFSTNLIVSSDIVLRYPLEVEIYSYPTPNSVILINNRELTFLKVLKFLHKVKNVKFELDKSKFDNVIKTTTFDRLQKLEKQKGFSEAGIDVRTGERVPFFNLGPKNDWRKYLDLSIKQKLEKAFKKEMIELSYM